MEKKFWLQFLGLTIVIIGATFLVFNQRYLAPIILQFGKTGKGGAAAPASQITNLKIVDSSGSVKAEVEVEIADTPEERNKGLGYRPSLSTSSGMFFIHDTPKKYTYWMKGMQFPIDIFWILDDRIVDIIPNIPPPISGQTEETLERYAPTIEANRVLETVAGFSIYRNIQVGDRIILGQ